MTGTEQEIRDYFDRNIERLIVGISDSSDDYEKARRIIESDHAQIALARAYRYWWLRQALIDMMTAITVSRSDSLADPIVVDETIK